jgi:hypothetical protein
LRQVGAEVNVLLGQSGGDTLGRLWSIEQEALAFVASQRLQRPEL